MEKMLMKIQSHVGHQGANEQSLNQTTIALHVSDSKGPLSRKTGMIPNGQSSSYVVKRNMPEFKVNNPLTRENSFVKKPEKVGTPQLGMLQNICLDESITFSGAVRIAATPMMAFDDSYGQSKRKGQTAVGPMYQEEPVLSMEQKTLDGNFDMGDDEQPGLMKQISAFPDSNDQTSEDGHLRRLYESKRYVPVALCISTETEFHDIFRQILLSLFDMIRVPENIQRLSYKYLS
jgi:hypothetical protein